MNKNYYKYFLIVAMVVALLFGFFFSITYSKIKLVSLLRHIMPQREFTSNTNVLIIGVDNSIEGTRRADTIMLVNINPHTKYIGVISIPRDTYLAVRNHGQTKINSAYAYGGIKLLRDSLADFLNIPIPYYVEINLSSVAQAVDEIGGVEINVEKRMYYVDHAGDLYIDLYPGKQVLDGNHAVQYIRFRKDQEGDIGRIKRQQKFIDASAKKALSMGSLFRVPRLIKNFSRHVKTNLNPSLIINLSLKMREAYELGQLDMQTLPGKEAIIDGISYLIPDRRVSISIITRLIKGYEIITGPLQDQKKPPELSVEILNGNGIKNMGKNAERKFRQMAYRIAALGDADHYKYKKTILVNWHSEQTEDEAFILARKLHLNPANIIHLNYPDKKIAFTLILGHDWPLAR